MTIEKRRAQPPRAQLAGYFSAVRANVADGFALLGRRERHNASQWSAQWTRGRLLLFALVAGAMALWIMLLFDAYADAGARGVYGPLTSFFRFVTTFGLVGLFVWPLLAFLILIALLRTSRLTRMTRMVMSAIAVRAGFLFFAIGAPSLVVSIIKRTIGRARPGIEQSMTDAFSYNPLVWKDAYASFPSGHSTTAFAVAIACGALWPRARPYLWAYAALVAISRVFVSAHFVSDICAGAVVGSLGALMVREYYLRRGLGFITSASGDILPKPGPSMVRIKAVAAAAIRQ